MPTLPDISVSESAWTNVYTATGLTVGVPLILQTKGDYVLLQCTGSIPSASNDDGVVLSPYTLYYTTSGEAGCFAKAVNRLTNINVQQGSQDDYTITY